MLRDWTGDWVGTFLGELAPPPLSASCGRLLVRPQMTDPARSPACLPTPPGHKGAVWQSKLSTDTSRAATASADFSCKIWDTYTGSVLHTFNHNHIVRTVALSPSTSAGSSSGAYVLTGGQEKKLRIFDLARPEQDPMYLVRPGEAEAGKAHEGNVRSVVWDSQDGNVAVSAGEEGVVRWWDLRTLEQTAELKLPDTVNCMELAHGGGTLCVTAGKSVIFLDIARCVPAAPRPPYAYLFCPLNADYHVATAPRCATGATRPCRSRSRTRRRRPRSTRSSATASSRARPTTPGCACTTSRRAASASATRVYPAPTSLLSLTGPC